MNDKQKQCFEMVYKHAHDERSANGNLIAFIDICFPDPEENEVSRTMHVAIKPYLRAREEMGKDVMELLYMLEEGALESGPERCPECGQEDIGQEGEYHCPACGLATLWDKEYHNEH